MDFLIAFRKRESVIVEGAVRKTEAEGEGDTFGAEEAFAIADEDSLTVNLPLSA